jgi:uncharacterized protein (DUF433 family)
MTAPSITLAKQYVEQREGCYRLIGSRVSLDSVVYLFRTHRSPERIVQSFPTLSLEQVYGAITFYLANQETVDTYLEEGEAEFSRLREESQKNNAELYAKLRAANAQNL